jgi:HD-like signal output (HDOD) protein
LDKQAIHIFRSKLFLRQLQAKWCRGEDMHPNRLREIIEQINDLPTLPDVLARVMEVLDNPYSSASDLTSLIKLDQAMMFRILKMANSAYYGFPRTIATVTESIVVLGFSTVRNLLLTTMMYNFDQLWSNGEKSGGKKIPIFNHVTAWKHSVTTAIACREIIRLQHQDLLEKFGYLAGLMHDVGKILFMRAFNQEYSHLLEEQVGSGKDLFLLENEILGANHGQVGAWMVDKWNLPKEIVEPIAYHHFPHEAKKYKPLTLILYHANRLAHAAAEHKSSGNPKLPETICLEFKDIIGPEFLPELIGKINQELQHIEAFMAV